MVVALGRRALPIAADAGSRTETEALVARAEKELGSAITVLVTSAATSVRQSLLETDPADFRRTMDVGLFGVFDCM